MQADSDIPHPHKLLEQVADRLRVKHYSLRTEKTYVDWIKRFIWFHGKRHPKEMGAPEVEAFLSHLAVEVVNYVFFTSSRFRRVVSLYFPPKIMFQTIYAPCFSLYFVMLDFLIF
jgi:hypothetical protein